MSHYSKCAAMFQIVLDLTSKDYTMECTKYVIISSDTLAPILYFKTKLWREQNKVKFRLEILCMEFDGIRIIRIINNNEFIR